MFRNIRNILFKTELFGIVESFVQQSSLNLGIAILFLLPSPLFHDILFTEVIQIYILKPYPESGFDKSL